MLARHEGSSSQSLPWLEPDNAQAPAGSGYPLGMSGLDTLEGELADCLDRLQEADRAQAVELLAEAAAATACYWAVAEGTTPEALLEKGLERFSSSDIESAALGVQPRATADSRTQSAATARAAATAFRELAFFDAADADALLRHFVWLMARLTLLSDLDEAFALVANHVTAA
jgi:hypothetical protein